MKVSNSWVLDKLNWLESKIIDNAMTINPASLGIDGFNAKLWVVGECIDGFIFVQRDQAEALEAVSELKSVPESATVHIGPYKMYLATEDDDTVRSYMSLLYPQDAT